MRQLMINYIVEHSTKSRAELQYMSDEFLLTTYNQTRDTIESLLRL